MREGVIIRQLREDEDIPYALLLLADPSRSLIDKYLKNSQIYVAQLEAAIIGVYVLCPAMGEAVSLEIKNIAVDSHYQGQGLGKLLLNDAANKAKEQGYQKIIIGTANSSLAQLRLYQQQGFEVTEVQKDFFIENYPEPIYENGILARDMLFLTKTL